MGPAAAVDDRGMTALSEGGCSHQKRTTPV